MKRLLILGMLIIPFFVGTGYAATTYMLMDDQGNTPEMNPYSPSMSACLAKADARNNVIGRTVYRCSMISDPHATASSTGQVDTYKYRPPHYYLHHPYDSKERERKHH